MATKPSDWRDVVIRLRAVEGPAIEPLVWAMLEVEVDVRRHEVIEVLFTQRQEMVQTFGLDRLNPAFHMGAYVGCFNRTATNFDTIAAEYIVEFATELGVAIMEDDLGLKAGRGQRFGECLGLCLEPMQRSDARSLW